MRKKEEDEKIYKKKQEQKRKMAARLEKEHEKTLKKKNPTLFETQGEKDQKEYGRVFKERLQELELMAKEQLYIDQIQAEINRVGKTKELKKVLKQAKMTWAKKRNSVEFFDERIEKLRVNLPESKILRIEEIAQQLHETDKENARLAAHFSKPEEVKVVEYQEEKAIENAAQAGEL